MPYIGNVLTSFAVETGNITDQAITSPKLSATGGTEGQVLGLDAGGNLVWSSDPAGQWVTSGDDIFYDTGNVGIGTNSPGNPLEVVGAIETSGSSNAVLFAGSSSTPTIGAGIHKPADDSLAIVTGSTERLRIDSDGRLLVGTDSSRTVYSNNTQGNIQVEGDTEGYNTSLSLTHNQGTGTNIHLRAPILSLSRTRGSTAGSNTIVQNNDTLGYITFEGADGTNTERAAEIRAQVDGTPGDNDIPGRLLFSTREATDSSPTTRMTIKSDGSIGINTETPASKVEIVDTVEATANDHWNLIVRGDDSGTNGESAQIFLGAINSNSRGVAIAAERRSTGNNHDMLFRVSGSGADPTERMRLNSDGRLLIGTDTSLGTSRLLQVADTSAEAGAELIRYVDAAGSSAVLSLAKSRGTSVGSNVTVGENDICGYIQFKGNNGTDFLNAAWITGEIDGEPNTGGDTTDMPGRLCFSTTSDGASSATERLRITSNGTIQLRNSPGIDFSQIQGAPDDGTSTSEVLDHYEQGTFTPEYIPTTGAFTTITYTEQFGAYTKIGNRVFYNIRIRTSSLTVGTASGVLQIDGFPFTCINSSSFGRNAASFSDVTNWGGAPSGGDVGVNTTRLVLRKRTAADGNTSSVSVSDMTTGVNRNQLWISGCYITET